MAAPTKATMGVVDNALRNRANHFGTQPPSSVEGLQEILDALDSNIFGGFAFAYNSATVADISAGSATSDDGAAVILTASGSVNLGATGLNALDAGSVANSTWYYVFAIRDPDEDETAYLASASRTAPTLPSGYTQKRLIGFLLTDGSGNIVPFDHFGEDWWWRTPANEFSSTTVSSSGALITMRVPPIVGVMASVSVRLSNGADRYGWIRSPSQANDVPDANNADFMVNANTNMSSSEHVRPVDGSGQLRCRMSDTSVGYLRISTKGFSIDRRDL